MKNKLVLGVSVTTLAGLLLVNGVFAMDSNEQSMLKSCEPIVLDIAEKRFGYELQGTSGLDSMSIAQGIVSGLQKDVLVGGNQENLGQKVNDNWIDEVVKKIKNINFSNEM